MDRYDFCRAVARDAGKLAHRAFGTSATTMKGRHDVVTAMDREVERFIRAGDRERAFRATRSSARRRAAAPAITCG
jgi:fructose-1,6-bisphosphatase/inositol monophosphatase family enzyme